MIKLPMKSAMFSNHKREDRQQNPGEDPGSRQTGRKWPLGQELTKERRRQNEVREVGGLLHQHSPPSWRQS